MKELIVISNIEIVGYCTSKHLIDLRNRADEYNQRNDNYFYWVVNNKKGDGYLLVREKS
jgi:hypothetical protein